MQRRPREATTSGPPKDGDWVNTMVGNRRHRHAQRSSLTSGTTR